MSIGARLPKARMEGSGPHAVIDYVKSLAQTMMEAHDRLYVEQANYARTIPIPTLGVGTTEFDITPARALALYDSGRAAAEKFLSTWDFDLLSAELHGLEGMKHMETAIVPGIYDPAVADEQLEIARSAHAGRSAHTIYGGHDHELRQTVIALTGTVVEVSNAPGGFELHQVAVEVISLSDPASEVSFKTSEYLRAGTRASTYAEHLLSMVRTVGRARIPAALALPMAQRSTFEGRLLAILEPAELAFDGALAILHALGLGNARHDRPEDFHHDARDEDAPDRRDEEDRHDDGEGREQHEGRAEVQRGRGPRPLQTLPMPSTKAAAGSAWL